MPARSNAREAVLEAGLALASEVGLSGLALGRLAEEAGLSKAGLYAHFESKEHLLREILRHAARRFVRDRVVPALEEPRGESRVRALFDAWIEWAKARRLPGGCVFISSAVELDDRPGPLREHLRAIQREWEGTLTSAVEAAVEEGHFRPDLDPRQFVFELYAVVMAFHHFDRFFDAPEAEERARRSFEALLARCRGA